MDPITLITTALTLGIVAGLKPAAEQAVKDAYLGLKTLIQDKYKINLNNLEKKPESEVQVAAVAEQLVDAGADKDTEIIEIAQALVEQIKKQEGGIEELDRIQVNLKKNKKFAFSVTGTATYIER